MNPVTLENYRSDASLRFRLQEQAGRERARAIGAAFAKLFAHLGERITLPRLSHIWMARWG